MNRKIIALVVLILLVASGAWLYNWVLGPTQAPQAPISAVPLAPAPDAGTTSSPMEATPPAAPDTPPAEADAADAMPAKQRIYTLDPAQSQARFVIFEELRGAPTDVVGATDQIAAEIEFQPGDLDALRIGIVRINARALATDNESRNRAIRNRILETDAHEFIVFAPTEIRGLSGPAVPGATHSFQIAGDLTIRDITRPTVFEAELEIVSNNELHGKAVAVVNRADFRLTIPNIPFVANVADEVRLEFEGVALPAD